MRRKLHIKRVVGILGGLFLLAAALFAVHRFQVQRNAYRLLELGDRAVEEGDYEKARTCYSHYLHYAPNDADTAQKYAQVLDKTGGEPLALLNLMEQVLRLKPAENALRLRLVEHLIDLGRIPDALEHLKKLIGQGGNQAELYHKRGWCQDANRDYEQAAQSFREAIKLDPRQIMSYALLAEVLQYRLNEPDEALKVMDDMVKSNQDAYLAYLLRSRFDRQGSKTKRSIPE